jgi:hypothetical protein
MAFVAQVASINIQGLHTRVLDFLSGSEGGFPMPSRLDETSKAELRTILELGFERLPITDSTSNQSHDGVQNQAECSYLEEADDNSNDESEATTIPDTIREHIRSTIHLTYAIALSQEHSFKHHGSCFKRNNKKNKHVKICRYNLPNFLRNHETMLGLFPLKDSDDMPDEELHLKRVVGCEYLTSYNDLLFKLAPSNHDVAFLRGRSTMYSVKYTAKPQETVDSATIVDRLVENFQRALDRKKLLEEQNPEWTDYMRGSSRLHSLLYQLTGVHEVTSTMASLYIYRDNMAFYESHPAVSLVLASALPAARGEGVELGVSAFPSDDGTHKCSNPYLEYLFRPLECEQLSWYEYCACFELINKPSKKKKKKKK